MTAIAQTSGTRTTGEKRSTRWISFRIILITVLFVIGFGVLAGRAVQLQVLERDRLGGLARDQYVRQMELQPRRGTITDRNGVVLAADAPADSIYADPHDFPGQEESHPAVKKLTRALGLDPKWLARRLARGGRFVWVKRRVSPAESEAVRALNLSGVGFVKESRRYYPRRELAGHLLGFVGDDGVGLEGVEVAFDDALQGESATVPSLRDARGKQLIGDAAHERVLEGARLELTIEQGLQVVAERALGEAVSSTRAAAGMAVAIDPRTGEVLVLANAPAFNPNARKRGDEIRNRAVLDTYEPGSTFKVFSISGALDEKTFRARDAIFCDNGSFLVGGHTVHDHKPLGWVGAGRIIATSSNIGAAKIAASLGRERLQRTLQAFGFGERTGIEIPGEPRGLVPLPRGTLGLATMAFGQGVTATPLQITNAMAVVANGGTLMKPWIVRRLIDSSSGRVLTQSNPTPIRRAISPETAATMRKWIEGVVNDPDGTGKKARVPGWRVAGKTGTGQKADPVTGGYSADKNFSSFVGYAPADKPQIVIGVFIDEPHNSEYGGTVAAPVFAEIARAALEKMGVPPTEPLAAASRPAAETPTPQARPDVGAVEPSGTIADADDEEPSGTGGSKRSGAGVTVPSLQGMTARAAVRALETAQLGGEISGTGKVVRQVPSAGAVVGKGTRVRLVLAPPG